MTTHRWVVFRGIPSGIILRLRFLQSTFVPKQMQGLAKAHALAFGSFRNAAPNKTNHITIHAVTILTDAMFDRGIFVKVCTAFLPFGKISNHSSTTFTQNHNLSLLGGMSRSKKNTFTQTSQIGNHQH